MGSDNRSNAALFERGSEFAYETKGNSPEIEVRGPSFVGIYVRTLYTRLDKKYRKYGRFKD